MGISFYGGVDPESGVVLEKGHDLEGQYIAAKILAFPTGKGSTVGSYTLYRLKANGKAPAAILNAECEPITAVGCIISEIPCMDHISLDRIPVNGRAEMDGEQAVVTVYPNVPSIPLQPWLYGREPGSFAEYTVCTRLKNIASRALEEVDWPSDTRSRLQSLIYEIPEEPIRDFKASDTPDASLWQAILEPYIGQNWLDVPWFVAEFYFFRRILEATGYFKPGPGQGIDPFRGEKQRSLHHNQAILQSLSHRLEELSSVYTEQALGSLMKMSLWGNQSDLSLWPVGKAGAPQRTELLVDDSPAILDYLSTPRRQIDFLIDNAGLELVFDLALADALLTTGAAQTISFHLKSHPTYVSDAMAVDVHHALDYLAGQPEPALRDLSQRVKQAINRSHLRLLEHVCWTLPLCGWEMPLDIWRTMAGSDLVLNKGDALYRRWLGDRHWPSETPLSAILPYFPAPLVFLRVCKSQVAAGMTPEQVELAQQSDPQWMTDGQWGVIQFIKL